MMETSCNIEYINKANQRVIEFQQHVFTSCIGLAFLDFNNINFFRVKNFIKEKRWSSIVNMKSAFKPKGEDWLIVYECKDANDLKYLVVVLDPIELWDDPYTLLIEPM